MKLQAILPLLCVCTTIAFPQGEKQDIPVPPAPKAEDLTGKIIEGDIRLPLPPLQRNGVIDTRYRWPNGSVPYYISPYFTTEQRNAILYAMEEYKRLTNDCIQFVQWNNHYDYVYITRDNNQGCYSMVGRQGGYQVLNYPDWCVADYALTAHEMFHALGFYHEQSRTDRDYYVTIMWQNIQPGQEYNFDRYGSDMITGYGYAYDYYSIVHYGQYAFSYNGQPTIYTTDQGYQTTIGTAKGLSGTDLAKLKAMYSCPAAKEVDDEKMQ